jgi:hypothetical protein
MSKAGSPIALLFYYQAFKYLLRYLQPRGLNITCNIK